MHITHLFVNKFSFGFQIGKDKDLYFQMIPSGTIFDKYSPRKRDRNEFFACVKMSFSMNL